MPIEEPARTGLTKSGQRSFPVILPMISSRSASRNVTDRGTATPLCATSLCALSLSMQSAEASVLQPTTGMPASSNNPCTVPSSPFFPCRTGKTRSTPILTPSLWPGSSDNSRNPAAERFCATTTDRSFARSPCQVSFTISSGRPV